MGQHCWSGEASLGDGGVIVEPAADPEDPESDVFKEVPGKQDIYISPTTGSAADAEHTSRCTKGRVTISGGGAQVFDVQQVPARADRDGFAGAAAEKRNDEEEACCLYWNLSAEEQCFVVKGLLERLHGEIQSCISLFQAEVLRDGATSGLIRGFPAQKEDMTAADVTVRIGQILCRYAALEDPPLSLFIGVHQGTMRRLSLPNSLQRYGYWGESPSLARQLALGSGKERMVHLSLAVKDNLSRLRLLPLAVAPTRESFYLDPNTEVVAESTSCSKKPSGGRTSVRRTRLSFCSGSDASAALPPHHERVDLDLDHFAVYLQGHGVDVAKFGKMSSTSLESFFKAVVVERTAHLDAVRINETLQLERIVVMVRVSLRVKDGIGQVRQLRLVSGDDLLPARMTKASQPLTIVVPDASENKEWMPSVQGYFREVFGIENDQQQECFTIDRNKCSYKEERSTSDLLPDIVTVYKSHNVILEVNNSNGDGMEKLGLPSFSDFYTEIRGNRCHYAWMPFEMHREDRLMELLLSNGVEVNDFSPNAFAELYDELYEKELSSLEFMGKELVRAVRIVKVELHADIFGVDHQLVIKAKYQKGACDERDSDQSISMRMGPEQDWAEAVSMALANRIGLSPEMQADHIFTDRMSYQVTEEIAYSRTYPGLKTIYEVNRVSAWVSDAQDGHLSSIGLPGATDFTFARWEKNSSMEGDGDRVLTQWSWVLFKGKPMPKNRRNRVSHMDSRRSVVRPEVPVVAAKRKVPMPTKLEGLSREPGAASRSKAARQAERIAPRLAGLMSGRATDWTRAKRAAGSIRKRDYNCKMFFDDILAAFPELSLYCIGEADATTCGRTADDEYQRTIGAFFALFWLMRMDMGGKEAFCYGLDDDWEPRQATLFSGRKAQDEEEPAAAEWRRRREFERDNDWVTLEQVVINAGLLKSKGGPHNEERALAMLVLLAIHDIMKLTELQPKVDKGIFAGFKAGETITDHDVALSFLLTRTPHVLPSFEGLSEVQKESVRFTHCKLEYNMGWFVQAEAPPGPLLRTFRKVVTSGKVPACDIAFYFVHWLTDLAGAEPFPMEGCEKFVLKFPQRILEQFIKSFSFLESLSVASTETQIVEDYLERRWQKNWGPLPEGAFSIARMRIACMAQQDNDDILNHFDQLLFTDKSVLGEEMALTGCKGQNFIRDSLDGSDYKKKGPAILVYYAPALLQKTGKKDPRGALIVLAEVFRKARLLWPLSTKDVDKSVTVRIDCLKELEISSISQAEPDQHFIMVKTSGVEAMIQLTPLEEFKTMDWKTNQILSFQLAARRTTVRRRRTQIE